MAITRETLRLIEKLRRDLARIADGRTRALTAAWVQAWDLAVPELGAALHELAATRADGRWPTRAQIARADRAQHVLNIVQARLEELARLARDGAAQDAAEALRLAGRVQGPLIASQLPPSAQRTHAYGLWDRVDPPTIDAIVQRTTEQITALTWPISRDATAAIRRELVRGILVGANPREAARRMLARLEGEFNGGLARALNISRTEMLDAHRAGAMLAQAAASDVVDGWIWVAQLGKRTCPSCWSKHGNVYPLTDPGPWDHQSGRCTRTPHVRTWQELGFSIPEPPSLLPDAQATFRALPRADQLHIMGPRRLELLDRGDITWADLSTRRTTVGWRDSFAPTPVRDLTPARS